MQNSGMTYGRAPRAVVLGAALALLLAATPASRGGAAPPVGPGLARLVRLDRAGFLGAGVQLRRLDRPLGAKAQLNALHRRECVITKAVVFCFCPELLPASS